MTENESIEILEERYLTMSMCGDIEQCKKNNQAISEAITALKEIHQYRAIGTVEECREAREKQREKKPLSRTHCKDGNHPLSQDIGRCPSCNSIVAEDMIWCDDCGQKLDWSE